MRGRLQVAQPRALFVAYFDTQTQCSSSVHSPLPLGVIRVPNITPHMIDYDALVNEV